MNDTRATSDREWLGAACHQGYKENVHITMVKKRLRDGSECRKCAQATQQLESRGLLGRIDEILEVREGDSTGPAAELAARFGIDTAPFFIVRDDTGEHPYTSVMRLIQDRLGTAVSDRERAAVIDPDDVGGI